MIDWLRRPLRAVAPVPKQPARRTISVGERELPLVIRRLHHARRMTLRLAPDGSEVRVSIPVWGRVGEAEAFARDRAAWLARHLEALPRPLEIEPGGHLPYRGEHLTVVWNEAGRRKPVTNEREVMVGGPRDGIARRLRLWLEAEALRLAAEDLAFYCDRAGQDLPRLTLSRARRRWGSCAADGSIRINWRLVMAPDHVRRSVVAHEVAHLAHFDHSPAFHQALGRIFDGEIEDANRWLKANGRELYRLFA